VLDDVQAIDRQRLHDDRLALVRVFEGELGLGHDRTLAGTGFFAHPKPWFARRENLL
jgi:hypothetical protein